MQALQVVTAKGTSQALGDGDRRPVCVAALVNNSNFTRRLLQLHWRFVEILQAPLRLIGFTRFAFVSLKIGLYCKTALELKRVWPDT